MKIINFLKAFKSGFYFFKKQKQKVIKFLIYELIILTYDFLFFIFKIVIINLIIINFIIVKN